VRKLSLWSTLPCKPLNQDFIQCWSPKEKPTGHKHGRGLPEKIAEPVNHTKVGHAAALIVFQHMGKDRLPDVPRPHDRDGYPRAPRTNLGIHGSSTGDSTEPATFHLPVDCKSRKVERESNETIKIRHTIRLKCFLHQQIIIVVRFHRGDPLDRSDPGCKVVISRVRPWQTFGQ